MDEKRPAQPEPSRPLLDALLDATRRLSTQTVMYHQNVARFLDLNITDHKCLDLVLGMGKATAGQLAEMTGLTTGAITSALNRLEKAGYVRRTKDPADLRMVIVEPVYGNLHPIREVFEPLGEAMDELHSRYGTNELKLILDYIERSIQVLIRQTDRLKKNAKTRRSET